MWLADTSVKRPVFATMAMCALVILGIVSYPDIGVDLLPKVDFPIVNISTNYKGASPEMVDTMVTDKIEEVVNTINGVKSINSSSSEGNSRITVEFVLERNIDQAASDVREKISSIRRDLPDGIDEPEIEKVDPDSTPVLWLSLSGQRSIRDLSTYADEVLKQQIERISGVGLVDIRGARRRQISVLIDAKKMQALQVTPGDIQSVLERNNVELPGGRIEGQTKEYQLKVKGEISNLADFGEMVISNNNGIPVRINDIGRVIDGSESNRGGARYNGIPAVGLTIQKQSGTNTVEVVNSVKKEIENIKKTLPPGMVLNISFDQSIFILRSVHEVQMHLIIGSIFAILAVLIFLRDLKTTLISAVALPVSVISTFALIRAFGFTFNNMTMLALSLSVGLLIDDAIIVIENIHRHIEEGMAPREASVFATSEIGLAVMATTFAIVAIFLPVAFMKGIIGRFFIQFALTVVFAVLVSLLVSFTLTPMMASIFLKIRNPGSKTQEGKGEGGKISPITRFSYIFERGYEKIEGFYRIILAVSLRHRAIVMIMAVATFTFGLYITTFLGKELQPNEDQGRFVVRLTAPIDYSVEQTDALCRKAEDFIRKMPEVDSVFYAQQGGSQINRATAMVNLIPKNKRQRSQEMIKTEIRNQLRKIPGLKASAENISTIGGGQRQVPIQYSVRGRDLNYLRLYSSEILSEFSKLPGVVDTDSTLEMGKPEFRVYIDRDKAADLGIDIKMIGDAIRLLISGDVDLTQFNDLSRGKRYYVRMRLNAEDRNESRDVGRIYVRARDGRSVQLANVVKIYEGGGPSVINRVDRQRAITIFGNLEKIPLGQAIEGLNAISAKILPPDYLPKYQGAASTMSESFGFLIFALILGITMAYMILAAQFESFIHPFTVLLAMPLSFIGAFGALWLTGKTINIYSLIGLILLMGLVKKNSILLVDYTNILRERGMERREAILHAGPRRLRPILMTTMAMIFGMVPVAFGVGEGAETRSPMGIAVIGGLITSLFLTLIVVPAAYDLFDDGIQRINKLRAKAK
jgi:hydrophobic/amphiphilic exporter-1 (mainly G- bacteria), HAE1 family